MDVLHIKKYNERQISKWKKNYDTVMVDVKNGKRNMSELPALSFYLFNKNYGYVATDGEKALWDKTKKGVIAWWKEEEKLKKIRGW